MIHGLKYIAVRIWIALFSGCVIGFLMLKLVSGLMEPTWAVLPAAVFPVAAFVIVGRLFDRVGRGQVQRLLKEASVWERAGMEIEADESFREAASVLDSYLISPVSKTKLLKALTAEKTRHCLARSEKDDDSYTFITSYLRYNAGDREAAKLWLEHILSRDDRSGAASEISDIIGANHPENKEIQLLLAQYYTAESRTDFRALQTYRYVMGIGGTIADQVTADVGDLFLKEGRADEWALGVYLKILKKKDSRRILIGGLAACRKNVRESARNRTILEQVDNILSRFDEKVIEKLQNDFRPSISFTPPLEEVGKKGESVDRLKKAAEYLIFLSRYSAKKISVATVGMWQSIRRLAAMKKARTALKWTLVIVFSTSVLVLVINTTMHISKGLFKAKDLSESQEKSTATVLEIADPFTLQVAAYLNPDDAKRFVKVLKEKGVDAYWTKAVSPKREWYQVRVSHFKTKDAAKKFGETLKQKHVIEDYYVANYKKPVSQ